MSGYTSLFMFWLGGNLGAGVSAAQAEAAIVGAILVYPALEGGEPSIYAALEGSLAVVPAVSGKPRRR